MVPWHPAMAVQAHRFSHPIVPRSISFGSVEPQKPPPSRAALEAATLDTLPVGDKGKTGLVIFLHGMAMSGEDFGSEIRKRLAPKLPWLQFHYPNAEWRTVTWMFGERVRAWFDVRDVPVSLGEEYSGLQEAATCVHDLIRQAEENGIPSSRIVLAGFSQGGALALQAGLTYEHQLAGIGAFAGWVPGNLQIVAKHKTTPIFFGHGEEDGTVPLTIGLASSKVLKDSGFTQVTFSRYRGLSHSFVPQEWNELAKFLVKALPKVSARNQPVVHPGTRRASSPGSGLKKLGQETRVPSFGSSTEEGESSEGEKGYGTTDDEQPPRVLRQGIPRVTSFGVQDAATRCLSPQGTWPRQRVLASAPSFHDDMSAGKSPRSMRGCNGASPPGFLPPNSPIPSGFSCTLPAGGASPPRMQSPSMGRFPRTFTNSPQSRSLSRLPRGNTPNPHWPCNPASGMLMGPRGMILGC